MQIEAHAGLRVATRLARAGQPQRDAKSLHIQRNIQAAHVLPNHQNDAKLHSHVLIRAVEEDHSQSRRC